MKWIKASDRLPDRKNGLIYIFANNKRTALMYVHLDYIKDIPALLQNNLSGWEWLDETEDWISVGDGLPKSGVYVMTFSPWDNEMFIDKIDANGDWDFGMDENNESIITHWQPLPSPPTKQP